MKKENRPQHGGNVYAAIRNFGGGFSNFLDFSANINPLGLSNKVQGALLEAMNAVTAYPDPDAIALKQAISDYYRVPAEWIETGNGAVELIYLLCRILQPARVLIPAPTFSEYEAAARAAGLTVEKAPLERAGGFVPSITDLSARLQPGDLLFLCNPNNPTGVVLTRQELEPLIKKAATVGAHILVDESFNDFRLTAEAESCRTFIAGNPSVIILHSLTKFLAVPGLRLGFLLGRPELVEQMKWLRDPWNVNVMAQAAGVAGLTDEKYCRDTVALVDCEKERMRQGLQAIPGLTVFPPSVNFVLAELCDTGWNAEQLQDELIKHRILIRNCANFSGLSSQYVRVAVKSPAENQRFLTAIAGIMDKAGVK